MTIFIVNLYWDVSEEDLKNIFNIYGGVNKCKINSDRDSGRKRDFGFDEMTNNFSERTAISDLKDVE